MALRTGWTCDGNGRMADGWTPSPHCNQQWQPWLLRSLHVCARVLCRFLVPDDCTVDCMAIWQFLGIGIQTWFDWNVSIGIVSLDDTDSFGMTNIRMCPEFGDATNLESCKCAMFNEQGLV